MNPLQNDTQSMTAHCPAPTTVQSNPAGLLLSRDLIFTTKVLGTAHALGYHIQVAGDTQSAQLAIERLCPQVVFVDLTAGEFVCRQNPERLCQARRRPDVWFVTLGPHVEEAALTAAKAAGCPVVSLAGRLCRRSAQADAVLFQPASRRPFLNPR